MATSAPRRVTRTAAPAATAPAPALQQRRLEIRYMDINDIVPYEWNPRDNEEAVASVANSIILTQGFAIPVVVDGNNVLVAGHTRVEAAKRLGMTEVPVVSLPHLTPEQINTFRVVDNKVASLAKWDFELLAGEISKLEGSGILFTDFGFDQAELDCMSQLVAADCLSTTELVPVAQEAAEEATRNAALRRPREARFVMGDIILYLPIEVYNRWADGIRQLCNFDKDAIEEEIKRRLNIVE
jgi:hypothetical protein